MTIATVSPKQKRGFSTPVKILLAGFFTCAVVLPLGRMLLTMAGTDVWALLSGNRFRTALGNSLAIAGTGMLIAVALAMALAWCLVRIRVRGAATWTMLFTLPMLIPSISHGTGLIVLFGANGVLTRLLGLRSDIYGFWGVVLGSVMYAFPVALLMIMDILKYEDSSPYEAAAVLGISRFRQATAITLPYLRRPMIAVFFSIFTLIVTDYGVPLMLGTARTLTLPVMMYQDVIEGMDFGRGSVIGLVLLLPALAAFLIDMLNKDSGNSAFVVRPFARQQGRWTRALAYALCAAVALAVLLPIASFVVLTFASKYPLDLTPSLQHIARTFQLDGGRYLLNSLLIALLVAVVGVAGSCVTAYLTARLKSGLSRALHLVAIASLAIPGLVLGLSYALFFKGSFLYGTLTILVLVNLVHFFASPYLMLYNAFGKIHENIEIVGETLGVGRLRMVLDVIIPQARVTLIEAFAYLFVNAMMTISAVSFLANSDTRPIALMIPSFEQSMSRESMAFVSLLILLANLLVKGAATLLKKRLNRVSSL